MAEALHDHLDYQVAWGRTVSQGDKAWDFGPEALASLDGGKDSALLAEVHKSACDHFQFVFDSLIVSDDAAERKARGLLLDRLIAALNHPASLSAFRAIAGEDCIAAYVINLTKGWRADWGGMLQFHNAGGDIPLALKPGFNTLHLFRVPQMHSVSYVAPFAGGPRYAVTGWLRR